MRNHLKTWAVSLPFGVACFAGYVWYLVATGFGWGQKLAEKAVDRAVEEHDESKGNHANPQTQRR